MTASHALSQLSYSPTLGLVYIETGIVNKCAENGRCTYVTGVCVGCAPAGV